MAVTSPDNIRTPDSGDQYALVQDLGVLADSTQAAITKRGNLYVGTAAQRTAFTTAVNGVNWQDTDGTAARYVRVAGAWVMQGDKAYSGPSAQRTAFTTAPAGVTWQDTDGGKNSYVRDGSVWRMVGRFAEASGTAVYTSNINAGTGATLAVTFPAGRFTVPPIVNTSASSGRITAGFNSVTATGFTTSADNWSAGPAPAPTIHWTAVQATATSAAG